MSLPFLNDQQKVAIVKWLRSYEAMYVLLLIIVVILALVFGDWIKGSVRSNARGWMVAPLDNGKIAQ